jgi:predicted negative regulator of RcsB-dependent stress response
MEVAVLLKVLDLAFLGFSAYMDYQDQQTQNAEAAEMVANLRQRVLKGEISETEALAEIDQIIGSVVGKRRAALAALPPPTGHGG